MATKVLVPQLGEGVEEVTIVNWLKGEGEPVDQYDALVEVETDKIVTEIPSPVTGILLKIEIPTAGIAVPVNTLLAWIGEPGESIPVNVPDSQVAVSTPADVKEAADQGDPEAHRVGQDPLPVASPIQFGRDPHMGFISPVVARIAAENQIDLASISGTGLGKRITKNDVLAYLKSRPLALQAEQSTPVPLIAPPMVDALVPHSTIRKRIAEHMVMSKRTSPHVTTLMEADLSRIVAHRESNKGVFAQNGTRLTFTAYFVTAVAEALKAHPTVNSSWKEEGILLHRDINIGVATDLGKEGLIVPVVKGADALSMLGISRAINDLAERARSKKLSPEDVHGATFTITNHGVSGSLLAIPIINQPQCAILGVGAIQKRVVVIADPLGNDFIAIRPMAYLTLTFDHRILDGAGADHFLAAVVKSLENWPNGAEEVRRPG